MVYLGYLLSFVKMQIALEPARIRQFLDRLDAIKDRGTVTKQQLQSIIGVIVFLSTVLGMKTYYRPLIDLLIVAYRSGQRLLTLPAEVRRTVERWFTSSAGSSTAGRCSAV